MDIDIFQNNRQLDDLGTKSELDERTVSTAIPVLLKLPKGASVNDSVNHPSHYQGKRECIDEMIAMFGIEDTKAFCRLNVFKYRYRAGKKAGNTAEQDLKKAEWYMDKLIELEGAGYGESKNMSKV